MLKIYILKYKNIYFNRRLYNLEFLYITQFKIETENLKTENMT